LNRETRRFVLVRLGLVLGVAAIAWMAGVRPMHEQARRLDAQVASRDAQIARHAQSDASVDADALLAASSRLRDAEALIMARTSRSGASELLTRLVNEAAAENGLAITSMESVATRTLRAELGRADSVVSGETGTVRVEILAGYAPILRFIDALRSGEHEVRMRTLRLSPRAGGGVRLHAEVTLTTLTVVPGIESERIAHGGDHD